MGNPLMIYLNARAIIEKIENNERLVLIQKRVSDGTFEFPGGCMEQGQSIIDAFRREILEETGLTVTKIYGLETYVHCKEQDVESIKPYLVSQYLQGWTNSSGERNKSVGIYFRCEVEGIPLEKGDNSAEIQWVKLEKLRVLLDEPNMFPGMDRGAAELYLSEFRK